VKTPGVLHVSSFSSAYGQFYVRAQISFHSEASNVNYGILKLFELGCTHFS